MELESCPFCGGRPIIRYIGHGGHPYTCNVYQPKEPGYVECTKCFVRTMEYKYARKAVKRWNERVEDE